MEYETRAQIIMAVLHALAPDELISTAELCHRARLSHTNTVVSATLRDYRFRPFRYAHGKWGRVHPNGLPAEEKLAELNFLREERKMLCESLGITVADIPHFLRERNIGVGLSDQRTQRSDIPGEVVNGDNHTDNQLGHGRHND